ncbi:hypothetical protein V6R56_15855, partial [Fusobacterium varium]
NDEDREWYRKQIYEFIQFMKETGTFEYVDMGIIVLDKRILSKEFQENLKIKSRLVEKGEEYWRKDRKYFVYEIRKNIMNELPPKFTPYIKLEEINKQAIKNSLKWSYYNNLLTVSLYSSKYIESKGWNKSSDPKLYEKLKTYDQVVEVEFLDEKE